MIRKDFIDAEIEKLTQVLARILRLKNEGNLDDALEVTDSTLKEFFDIDQSNLPTVSLSEFEVFIKSKNYSQQKLDMLGKFLLESVYPFEETADTLDILHKVLLVFNLLEREHHIQSLENYSRIEMINKFLNTRQYE